MSSRVYAAARAVFPLQGKSKEEAWKELTGMFNQEVPTAYTSYILLHHRLRSVNRHRLNDISLGDTFKYTMNAGSEMCVEIVECTPFESFAYDEGGMPRIVAHINSADETDSRTRMQFLLRSEPEATLVEIRRRQKGDIGTQDLAQHAAETLQHILTGEYWKNDETTRGDLTIERDDSYRIDF